MSDIYSTNCPSTESLSNLTMSGFLTSDSTSLSEYFLILCHRPFRNPYEEEFGKRDVPAYFATTTVEVQQYGFMYPPLAIIVDESTAASLGHEKVAKLFRLGVRWPVMRGSVDKTGAVQVKCLEPARTKSLATAIHEITNDLEGWTHPTESRLFIRINTNFRARLTGNSWAGYARGNVLSVSIRGAFITIDKLRLTVGECVEIELLDLAERPCQVSGRIRWCKLWEDGPGLPGIGVDFDQSSVSHEVRLALGRQLLSSLPHPLKELAQRSLTFANVP